MASARPGYVPLPYQEAPDSGRLILVLYIDLAITNAASIAQAVTESPRRGRTAP